MPESEPKVGRTRTQECSPGRCITGGKRGSLLGVGRPVQALCLRAGHHPPARPWGRFGWSSFPQGPLGAWRQELIAAVDSFGR